MPISAATTGKRWRLVVGSAIAVALVTAGIATSARSAQPASRAIVQISQDIFANRSSQHQTQVEPGSATFGNTIVVANQTGRFNVNGGASDITWATSTNAGKTWNYGALPGITKIQQPGSPYDRASDPAVAYDAKHGMWLIESLPILEAGGARPAMVISRSPNGLIWSQPISVGPNLGDSDKTWITCDNWTRSPFYGHCYAEWDSVQTGLVNMSTSTDGGLTWGPALNSADSAIGQGGLPQVQPNGNVIVPFYAFANIAIDAFRSTNGGTSWGSSVAVATVNNIAPAGGLRGLLLPGAGVDGSGRVYVVWSDCSFRTGCSSNDMVISSSTNGLTWSAPAPIPIDPLNSTVDHFIPGLAVDPNTKGSTAHLALAYYYYPQANCTFATCQLDVGIISSHDSGASWSAPVQLAGPLKLGWLPMTSLGPMVGDYITASIVGGKAFAVLANADRPSGRFLEEAMFTNTAGIAEMAPGRRFTPFGMRPVAFVRRHPVSLRPVPLD